MTDRQPNFPELKRMNLWVQAQNKLEPGARVWVQDGWVTLRENEPMCKTAFCLAGATIVRAGHELRLTGYMDFYLDGEYISSGRIPELADEILGIDFHNGLYYDDDDLPTHYADDYDDRIDLYTERNTAADIDREIKRIFKEHGVSYAQTKAVPDRKIQITSK